MRNIPTGSSYWFITVNLLILAIAPSGMASAFTFSQDNSQRSSSTTASIIQTSSSPGLNLTLNTPSVTVGLGEDAIVELTIIGMNGFNDTVALSSSIAPDPPGTNAGGFSASFRKDAFRISPANPSVQVNVTINAYTLPPYLPAYPPLGSYTMTVFTLGQTWPQYLASAKVRVTVTPYRLPDPKLLFELGYKGPANPGATIQLDSNFTDVGNTQLVVSGLSFGGDFGTLSEPSGLPMSLFPGEKKALSLNLTIPSGMLMGSHRISSMSTWEYYVPNYYNAKGNNFYSSGWTVGNAVVVSGSIAVVANTPPFGPPASVLSLVVRNPAVIVGLSIYAFLAALASILVIRRDRRKVRRLTKMEPA